MAKTSFATVERLRELLHYDPETGEFHWTQNAKHRRGMLAGSLSYYGYRQILIDYKPHFAHRVAWAWVHGEWPKGQIDHINGNRLDNRITNLRDVSAAVNSQNRRVSPKKASGLPLGVTRLGSNKKFTAYLKVDGKSMALGRFDTPAEASEAYIKAKRQFHEGCTL